MGKKMTELSPNLSLLISPQDLEQSFIENKVNLENKIKEVAKASIEILKEIGQEESVEKIRNIVSTLIQQEDLYSGLFELFENIFETQVKLKKLLDKSNEDQKRAIFIHVPKIIDQSVFKLQRETLFKIVHPKTEPEGKATEDGPALIFPAVEQAKNKLLSQLAAKLLHINPVLLNVCKSYQGVTKKYGRTERKRDSKETSTDDAIRTISQFEKSLKEKIDRELSSKLQSNLLPFLNSLITDFMNLLKLYEDKKSSLTATKEKGETVAKVAEKISILNDAQKNIKEIKSSLNVLRSLIENIPRIKKQVEYFAESHYQARAVLEVLKETDIEMSRVFDEQSMASLQVVNLLQYKLMGSSHMYESINYYYAAVQIEDDMRCAFEKCYPGVQKKNLVAIVQNLLEKYSNIPEKVLELHKCVVKMNQSNHEIHQGFMKFKQDSSLSALKKTLANHIKPANLYYSRVRNIYKNCQDIFLNFLEEEVQKGGSTPLVKQMITKMDNLITGEEGLLRQIKKNINKEYIPANKKFLLGIFQKITNEKTGLPKELIWEQANQILIENKLFKQVQPFPPIQNIIVEIIKEFIQIEKKGKEEEDKKQKTEEFFLEKIKAINPEEFENFQNKYNEKQNTDKNIPERDLIVKFVARNITPHEIESFARLLPGLPRNELQLDSSLGRLLLDIKSAYKELLLRKSTLYIHTEKQTEKNEYKLVQNIYKYLSEEVEPFLRKTDEEEEKIEDLISFERHKWIKDIKNVISYWKFLIKEQTDPGQGKQGKFRKYSEDEIKKMARYINPNQLGAIEKQLEKKHELELNTKLYEVQTFLMKLASELFSNFDKDPKQKKSFAEDETKKKIKRANPKDQMIEVVDNPKYMPNIKAGLEGIEQKERQKQIDNFFKYVEYCIDQQVPSSKKRKCPAAPKIILSPNPKDVLLFITVDHLQRLIENLDRILTIREEKYHYTLLKVALPLLQIAEKCSEFVKKDKGKVSPKMKRRKEELGKFSDDPLAKQAIDNALQIIRKKQDIIGIA